MTADRSRFYPLDAAVPHGVLTEQLRLEPLTTRHGALDYAAVILSRTMLRTWSGSDWPADDFTLDDNLSDLARHEREHQERLAFTYTVLSPDGKSCLGCVYLVPNTVALLEPRAMDALARFWLAAPLAGSGLDGLLLSTLRRWLRDEFAFGRVLYHANSRDTGQLHLLRGAGLTERAAASIPGRGGLFVFFEDPD